MERGLFTQDQSYQPPFCYVRHNAPVHSRFSQETMYLNCYNSENKREKTVWTVMEGWKEEREHKQKAASPLSAGDNKGKEFLKPMSVEEVLH